MATSQRSGDTAPGLEPASPADAKTVSRGRAGVTGALAAAAALGVGELAAGLIRGATSLVIEIGDQVIDLAPGGVERTAIEVVGSLDKPLLLTGIVGISLLLGSVFGQLAARRFLLGAAGFVAFAVVGAVAAFQDPRASRLGSVLVALIAAAVGVGVLRLLLRAGSPLSPQRRAQSSSRRIGPDGVDRRGFLRVAMGTAVAASVSAVGGKLLAGRDRVSAIRASTKIPRPLRRAAPPPPAGAELAIAGLSPLFVPNASFYRIDTALAVPQVDTTNWSLEVKGKVARPLKLSYQDLLDMPHIEADVTLSCVSNEVGGDLVGNARWQGVALRELLDRAGVQPGGTQIVGRSVDDFTAGFPTAIGMDTPNAMVAVAMNGEPLPARHGFPARLVIPGLYGYVSATKWLASIELVDFDEFNGYWIPRGWSKLGPVKTQSRIDTPRRTAKAGRTPIAGVAWAPTRGISKVEVNIDGGPWQLARLAEELHADTWRQWVYDWDATPGPHSISVRATDGKGVTQTEQKTEVAPDGASGHHTVGIEVSA